MANGKVKTFQEFLHHIDGGKLHEEITEYLGKISTQIQEHVDRYGGEPKASLKLSFKFKLKKGVVEIDADCDCKLPKAPPAGTMMWPVEGGFSVNHPRQVEMFGPRDATKSAAE